MLNPGGADLRDPPVRASDNCTIGVWAFPFIVRQGYYAGIMNYMYAQRTATLIRNPSEGRF